MLNVQKTLWVDVSTGSRPVRPVLVWCPGFTDACPVLDPPCGQQPVTHTRKSRTGSLETSGINSSSSLTHTHAQYTSDTHQTNFSHHDTNIYCTQLHRISLSHTHTHTHTQMPGVAASMQFLNGPAVRVRLMVSQPPPSACISVHLSAQHSHRPLNRAQWGLFASSSVQRLNLQQNAVSHSLIVSQTKTKVPLCQCLKNA